MRMLSEERSASIFRAENTISLLRNAVLVFRGATERNSPEDGKLQSHRRENLKSYIAFIGWAL
jgi:hypothetical protein